MANVEVVCLEQRLQMTADENNNDPLRVSKDDERGLYPSHPCGTLTVLIINAIAFALLWPYSWYGLFLPAAPVRWNMSCHTDKLEKRWLVA